MAEPDDEAPVKAGMPSVNAALWSEIESHLGTAVNRCDRLHKQNPHTNYHRDTIAAINLAMTNLHAWRQAVRP